MTQEAIIKYNNTTPVANRSYREAHHKGRIQSNTNLNPTKRHREQNTIETDPLAQSNTRHFIPGHTSEQRDRSRSYDRSLSQATVLLRSVHFHFLSCSSCCLSGRFFTSVFLSVEFVRSSSSLRLSFLAPSVTEETEANEEQKTGTNHATNDNTGNGTSGQRGRG